MKRHQSKTMKNKPMRRCVGCRTSKEKETLLRIAFYESKLKVSPQGKGRGVYVCPNVSCIEKARKRGGIEQALRQSVSNGEKEKIFSQLYQQCESDEKDR